MRCTERIDHPGTTVVAVSNQSADADNRMVDVLGELVAHGSADVVVGPADKVIGGSVATRSGIVSMSQTMTLAQGVLLRHVGWAIGISPR